MKKLFVWLLIATFAVSMAFMGIGCKKAEEVATPEGEEVTEEPIEEEEMEEEPTDVESGGEAHPVSDFAAAQIEKWKDYTIVESKTRGLSGEKPIWFSEILKLTDEEIKTVREANAKVAFAHNWVNLGMEVREQGAKRAFEELNMQFIAVTDAEMNPAKQKTDIETLMALNPDVIISLAIDRFASETFQPAVEKGVVLSYLSGVPADFTMGKEYAGMVTDDCYEMGAKAAKILADAITEEGKDGKIGYLYHGIEFWNTNEWDKGFKETIESMPNMEIVASQGFVTNQDAEEIVAAWITKYPEMNGVYASFSGNAEYALSAIRAANRSDIKLTTCELSETLAMDLAESGNVVGSSIDTAFLQGYIEAYIAAWGILHKVPESFVIVPAISVTRENLADMWFECYQYPLPPELLQKLD